MSGAILIGYDGSASAAHAIRVARSLTTADSAIVATVWEPALPASPTLWGDGPVDAIDVQTAEELNELTSDHAEEMARHGAELARRAGFEATTTSSPDEANVPETLADMAARLGVDAIVVGSHGHGALHTRVLGSTSTGLLRHARCPVLVVPRPGDDAS